MLNANKEYKLNGSSRMSRVSLSESRPGFSWSAVARQTNLRRIRMRDLLNKQSAVRLPLDPSDIETTLQVLHDSSETT